jgi:hypothetical protein
MGYGRAGAGGQGHLDGGGGAGRYSQKRQGGNKPTSHSSYLLEPVNVSSMPSG